MGLLEHFVHIFALKPNLMVAFYASLGTAIGGDGLLTHPDATARATSGLHSSCGRWLKFVSDLAGSNAALYTMEATPTHCNTRFVSWHSDAARDNLAMELTESGLGGYAAG